MDPNSRTNRRAAAACVVALLGLAGLALVPQASRAIHLAQLLLIGMIVSGLTFLLRRKRVARFVPVVLVLLPLLVFALPGRAPDPTRLGAACVGAMNEYLGTPYVWGGESRRGIDCSGLMRRGLRDAAWSEGIAHGNGRLLRLAADLWWHDASARALGEGHRGLTQPVLEAPNVATLDTSPLRPGDMAITSDGVHVLAFIGGTRWIEADPSLGRVVVLARDEPSPWLRQRVRVVRWTILSDASASSRGR